MANYRQQTGILGPSTNCPSCVVINPYTAGASVATSALACASTDNTYTFYFEDNDISSGVTVYTNEALTDVFTGDSEWYRIDFGPNGQAAQINSSGQIFGFLTLCA